MSLARTGIAARLLAVAALAALTAGCFQPMYAERGDGAPGLREKLMGVELLPVDKPNASREARIGVEIRNALAFKLYGTATGMPSTHRLVLRFNTSRTSLMTDPNTTLPTSENYGIDALYNLIESGQSSSYRFPMPAGSSIVPRYYMRQWSKTRSFRCCWLVWLAMNSRQSHRGWLLKRCRCRCSVPAARSVSAPAPSVLRAA